ncbi:hypothetical protein FACS1894202_01640 [Clostridia bacterium]|nr:hypothetical protein FACS1894202_01640 [Clostridia bacterium]
MRVFLYELKKLWNLKTTTAILAFFGLYFGLFLMSEIKEVEQYKSDPDSKMNFELYEELLGRYGTVIDRDEIIDFGIDEKIQGLIDRADSIIENDKSGIFAKYGIQKYEEVFDATLDMPWEDYEAIVSGRNSYFRDLSLELSLLRDIKQRYDTNDPHLNSHISETSFVYARELAARENRSVMPYYIPEQLSVYSAMLTILCVICSVLLVSPFVATDRTRKVYLLQYSSSYGRKILGTQFAAVIASAFVLSLVLTAFCGAMYATLNMQMFWDVSIISFWGVSFYMFGVTYGQYALLLAVMPIVFSVAAACAGFVLSRFSDNYAKLFIKVVPLGLIGIIVGYAAISNALSNENTVFVLFGRCLLAPEVILCGLLIIFGVTAITLVLRRERRVDI